MTGPFEAEEHVDLSGLVRGELANDDVLRVADHLRTCSSCRDELVEVAVGHAVLTRAVRVERPVAQRAEAAALPRLAPLPVPRRGRRPSRRTSLVLAAAVALLAGVAGIVGVATSGLLSDDDPQPVAERVSTLDPVTGGTSGQVRVAAEGDGSRLTIVADDLPAAGDDAFYQAWLLDPATNQMLPLGPLSGDTSRFRVDNDLLASYSVVDVSLELDDGDPAHSATSVLRGGY